MGGVQKEPVKSESSAHDRALVDTRVGGTRHNTHPPEVPPRYRDIQGTYVDVRWFEPEPSRVQMTV